MFARYHLLLLIYNSNCVCLRVLNMKLVARFVQTTNFLETHAFYYRFRFFPEAISAGIHSWKKKTNCMLVGFKQPRFLCVYKMAFFMHVIVLFSILFCLNCLGIIICVCRLLHKWMNHQTNQISIVIAVGFFLRHNYLCIVSFTIDYYFVEHRAV